MRAFGLLALLAGCSSILGIEDLPGPNNSPDGDITGDTPPPPGSIRIAGTAEVQNADLILGTVSRMPLGGAELQFVPQSPAGPPLVTSSTPMGGYEIIAEPPVRGFVRMNQMAAGGHRPVHNYAPTFAADAELDVLAFTDTLVAFRASQVNAPDANGPFLMLLARGNNDTPLVGMQFSLGMQNQQIFYADKDLNADPMLTSTTESGAAYMFGLPPGSDSVTVRLLQNNQPIAERTLELVVNGSASDAVVHLVPGDP
jgi:hypothetical protein